MPSFSVWLKLSIKDTPSARGKEAESGAPLPIGPRAVIWTVSPLVTCMGPLEILWLKVEERFPTVLCGRKIFPHQKHTRRVVVIVRVHALYRGFHVSLADSTHELATHEVKIAVAWKEEKWQVPCL